LLIFSQLASNSGQKHTRLQQLWISLHQTCPVSAAMAFASESMDFNSDAEYICKDGRAGEQEMLLLACKLKMTDLVNAKLLASPRNR
jgi:hypothetical protein